MNPGRWLAHCPPNTPYTLSLLVKLLGSCFQNALHGPVLSGVAGLSCLLGPKVFSGGVAFSAETRKVSGQQDGLDLGFGLCTLDCRFPWTAKSRPAEHVRTEHPGPCCPMEASISRLVNTLLRTLGFIEAREDGAVLLGNSD